MASCVVYVYCEQGFSFQSSQLCTPAPNRAPLLYGNTVQALEEAARRDVIRVALYPKAVRQPY